MDGVASSSTTATFPLYHPSVKRSFSVMSEDYRSSSPDSLFVSQDDRLDSEQPPQRRRLHTTLALPPRPPRTVGDGYDYRRPAISSQGMTRRDTPPGGSATVIDLTGDEESRAASTQTHAAQDQLPATGSSRAQRLPRFHGRNIIDVEEEDIDNEGQTETRPSTSDFIAHDQWHESHIHNHHPHFSVLRRPQRMRTSDPEIDDLLFLEERPRSRAQTTSRAHTPAAPMPRSVTPYPNALNNTIDLTGDDDDVVHLESRVRPQANLDRPVATASVSTRSSFMERLPMIEVGGRLFNRLASSLGARTHEEVVANHVHEGHRNVGVHHNHDRGEPELRLHIGGPAGRNFTINMLNYETVAFDLGLQGGNRPPTPRYEPPEAAKSGFTRSPGEDEVVVCPNCGDELAMGSAEEKQEVWVIKKCGHAYCGVCARNRSKGLRTSKKGKGKAPVPPLHGPPPFKTCVVDGCKEPAAKKSMVHVFLGS